MGISSNTLIHFTNSKDTLFDILKFGFFPAHCWEQFIMNNKIVSLGVPMVSFCDIPLSQVKDHLLKYGGYGIGMTLEWARRKGLNPVFYLDSNSEISNEINNIGNFIFQNAGEEDKNEKEGETVEKKFHDSIISSYLTLMSSMKNYQGVLKRKDEVYKNYKFYDEREWRYIPTSILDKVIFKYDDYIQKRGKSPKKPLLDNLSLSFNALDIKYIIIKDETEVSDTLKHIQAIDDLGRNHIEIEMLGTKILTSKQIFEDF